MSNSMARFLEQRYAIFFGSVTSRPLVGDMEAELKNSGSFHWVQKGEEYQPCWRLSEDRIRNIAAQMMMGLYQLHGKGFIHGDVKLPNLLVFPGKQGKTNTIKLADFGTTRIVDTVDFTEAQPVGTLDYMAPEMLEPSLGESEYAWYNYSVRLSNLLPSSSFHTTLHYDNQSFSEGLKSISRTFSEVEQTPLNELLK